MGDYIGKMPFQGIPGKELQPVRVETIEFGYPPRWKAAIQSISPPRFTLELGQDLWFTSEELILAALAQDYGLTKD